MKLDQIVLTFLAIVAVLYITTMAVGMLQVLPFGLIGLAILAFLLWVVGRIIYERLHNAEDDYYEKNVDK